MTTGGQVTQQEFEEKGVAYAERLLVHWQDEEMVLQMLMIAGIREDDAKRFIEQAKENLATAPVEF